MADQIAKEKVLVGNVADVLGRLSFSAAAVEEIRPFLGPVYAFVAALQPHAYVALPGMVKIVFQYLIYVFGDETLFQAKAIPAGTSGQKVRADAKAEGNEVVVGGWIVPASGDTKEAPWYGLRLCKATAPWAYAAGEPFRTIASLELYATLLCIVVFDLQGQEGCLLQLAGETDNGGNPFVTAKMMTTKWPLAAILMEIGVQVRKRQVELNLGWIPRLQNIEADAITNSEYGHFKEENRVPTSVEELNKQFILLPKLLEVGQEFVLGLKEAKEVPRQDSGKSQRKRKRPMSDRLRVTDPW